MTAQRLTHQQQSQYHQLLADVAAAAAGKLTQRAFFGGGGGSKGEMHAILRHWMRDESPRITFGGGGISRGFLTMMIVIWRNNRLSNLPIHSPHHHHRIGQTGDETPKGSRPLPGGSKDPGNAHHSST
ncbi:hypothetical protein DAPPUDRAFT_256002 [Daphnia pulex]|uniref:Uncharacterized protein n=1 Tax=Daphnia pulex TaxID=6669 RepID=E9HAH3_DAPPU|nr:hypothetical protein DAPPUDRAFT_256002 [Daphnia pulex]|eukprot:EFX71179.1 hypothetical protein DAPPUDRAFT_256002 [Daphnia pulex]